MEGPASTSPGTPTTAASALRRDAPPAAADAPVVARLAAAGMVCVGKTNLSELAFSGLGTNPHFGTPPNPRAPGRVPGGSSSGSAVAVAAGIVPVAIGTDTAGSIRVPAAFCRVAGFKPSAARIDRTGLLPLAPTLDSIGPLAAGVADLIAVDAALRGAGDAARRPARRGDAALRLVVPAGDLVDDVEPSVAARFAADLDALAAAGARIERRPLAALDRARALLAEHGGMVAHEAWRGHARAARRSPDAERLDPPVLRRLREGRALPAGGLRRARARAPRRAGGARRGAGRRARRAAGRRRTSRRRSRRSLADVERFLAVNARTLRATLPLSFLDMPGVTLPSGLLLSGPSGADDRVLAAALAAEAALARAAGGASRRTRASGSRRHRRRVGALDEPAAGDRLEQQQVAGVGLVPAGDQAVDHPHAALGRDHQPGPARCGRRSCRRRPPRSRARGSPWCRPRSPARRPRASRGRPPRWRAGTAKRSG